MAAEPWTTAPTPLKFRIGPFGLAGVSLRLKRRWTVSGRDTAATVDDEPQEPLAAGEHGYLVWLQPIPPDLPSVTFLSRTVRYVAKRYWHYTVDLSGSRDAYWAKFSAKTRSTLRRKLRKFAELSGGAIDCRAYRTPGEVDDFYALARAVSARTYQERLIDAGLPTTPEFREEMQALAARDRVRAYLLFHNGQPVSYLYCREVIDGRLFYAYLGYDPDYAAHSPGTVLQVLALERLFAEGRRWIFDFGEGEGDHKKLFATHATYCGNVFYLRRTPALVGLVCLHLAFRWAPEGMLRLLDRVGLKDRLKRAVRSLGVWASLYLGAMEVG